ncbi:MAG: DNA mismatch repair protein MutS, partial [Acidobacteriota bacterium]
MELAHPQPHAVYSARLSERAASLTALESQRQLLGWARLAAAALTVGSIWMAIQAWIPLSLVLFPIAVFGLLVWRHAVADRASTRVRRAIAFCERGLARLENRWQGLGETGERFADPHHPYAADLVIFGRGSLFEFLSTARTRGGEARLAGWLKAGSPIAELKVR